MDSGTFPTFARILSELNCTWPKFRRGSPQACCHVICWDPFHMQLPQAAGWAGGGERRDDGGSGSSRNNAARAAEIRGRCQQEVPSEGGPTGQFLAGTPPPAAHTHNRSLGVRQGLELPAAALTTLLWEGPLPLLAHEILGEEVLGILWGFMRANGCNSLLIPSWARRGRDCLLSSRLMLSDTILQAKIWGYGNVCPLSSISPMG